MKIRSEFIVGIFAVLGVTALILGFFWLKGQSLFGEKQEYFAIYDNADGFTEGSAVKLNGVQVGKVVSIDLHPNDIMKTLIKFEITNDKVNIPLTTKAEMKGDLLGTVSINLKFPEESVGDNYHVNGDTLVSGVAENITETIEAKVDPLVAKINKLLGTADGAIGTIENLFGDNTNVVTETFNKLNKSMTHFVSISRNVDSLAIALNNNKYQITSTLTSVNSITANLKKSNDTITQILSNVNTVSANIAQLNLLEIQDKANDALTSVNLILDEIQNGDGTLTKLMQDSLLYDNVNVMIEEATSLVENIKTHPNRYIQFSIFGGKDKGLNLPKDQEVRMRKFAKDSLKLWYPN